MKNKILSGRIICRGALLALLILCLALGAAGCGKSSGGGDSKEAAGQQEGLIVYAGDGRFAVSGFSSEYDNTDVQMVLDDEELGSVGGANTAGDSYLIIGTNVQEAVPEETEGYQKLVVKLFGSPDLSTDERTENSLDKTFYIKCADGERFRVNAIVGTDEKASPPDWEWK